MARREISRNIQKSTRKREGKGRIDANTQTTIMMEEREGQGGGRDEIRTWEDAGEGAIGRRIKERKDRAEEESK